MEKRLGGGFWPEEGGVDGITVVAGSGGDSVMAKGLSSK